MDVSWLDDWSFWAWAIPVAVTIAFGSFQVGVWWSGRDRTRLVQEREDREYRKRNSAVLRVTQMGFDDFGRLSIGIRNAGDHGAEFVQGAAIVRDTENPLPIREGCTIAPQDGIHSMIPLGEKWPGRGCMTTADTTRFPREILLQVTYSDGLGSQCRRWKLIFEPKGEHLHEWHMAAVPLEG